MMRTINKYTTALAAAALLAAACSSEKTETPLPPSCDKPICWNVKMEDGTARSTRYLIGNDSDAPAPSDPTDHAYYLPLEDACKPEAEGGKYGYAVGLFGDYTYTEGGKEVTVYDLFRGTRLVSSENKSGNPKWVWNYESATKYWHPGAKYIFRAYYPQRIYNYTVSTSNATTLAIVYPTRKLQYDLLLGCTTVEEATAEQMGKAVDIEMGHALAALRFEFRLGFADEDWLTSVYLLNDEGRSYFSQGTVAYGDLPTAANPTDDEIKEARKKVKWLPDYNPPATEELYKWVPPTKYWEGKDTPPPTGAENPVYMNSTLNGNNVVYGETASAYYGKPKTEDADDAPVVGEEYCRNSGWLLIIPQQSYGKLSVCFTTKKGGKTVYKVALPAVTEKDKDGNPITEWKAGKRYTYTITLSRSDLGIDVEVKEWNRRNHSTEIVF